MSKTPWGSDIYELDRGLTAQQRGVWQRRTLQGRQSAAVSCPTCGLARTLATETIDGDGNVSPMFECTNILCAFMGYLRLKGWPE